MVFWFRLRAAREWFRLHAVREWFQLKFEFQIFGVKVYTKFMAEKKMELLTKLRYNEHIRISI